MKLLSAKNVTYHTCVSAVVAAQNQLTESVLEECDTRSKFKDMMTEMYDFPKVSCPFQRGQPGGVLRCTVFFLQCGIPLDTSTPLLAGMCHRQSQCCLQRDCSMSDAMTRKQRP